MDPCFLKELSNFMQVTPLLHWSCEKMPHCAWLAVQAKVLVDMYIVLSFALRSVESPRRNCEGSATILALGVSNSRSRPSPPLHAHAIPLSSFFAFCTLKTVLVVTFAISAIFSFSTLLSNPSEMHLLSVRSFFDIVSRWFCYLEPQRMACAVK